MNKNEQTVDISQLTIEQIEVILKEKREQENKSALEKREAYQGIRADVCARVHNKVKEVVYDVKCLFDFVKSESDAWYQVMKEYGMLKRECQLSYKIEEGNFRLEVKSNKVKKFDERADIASARLIEFLLRWIENKSKGTNDPMYQLAMTSIERNQNGDLDYKQVSRLYDLEQSFNDSEYSEIMQLFKESNVIEGTATNYYFYEKNERGVWIKLEPNFNRM